MTKIESVIKELSERFEGMEELAEFSNEDKFCNYCHTMLSNIGMRIRNEYDLWNQEGELHLGLCAINIEHPDDMSDYLIRRAYRLYKRNLIKRERFKKLNSIR